MQSRANGALPVTSIVLRFYERLYALGLVTDRNAKVERKTNSEHSQDSGSDGRLSAQRAVICLSLTLPPAGDGRIHGAPGAASPRTHVRLRILYVDTQNSTRACASVNHWPHLALQAVSPRSAVCTDPSPPHTPTRSLEARPHSSAPARRAASAASRTAAFSSSSGMSSASTGSAVGSSPSMGGGGEGLMGPAATGWP